MKAQQAAARIEHLESERDSAVSELAEARRQIVDLEEALRDCVVLAASQMGGLAALDGKPYAPRYKEIINRAQRLLGGRELP